MSRWLTATVAANSAVMAPTHAMTCGIHVYVCTSNGDTRTMRYTPEVTIVAAWMSADTGVGPAMASGSHTYSGSCADLPIAPKNNSAAMPVAVTAASDASVLSSRRPMLWAVA